MGDSPRQLANGDHIGVGDVTLVFRFTAEMQDEAFAWLDAALDC
ncbi:hypothetical protein [Micromonospora sp. CPCC 206061]